MTAGKVCTYVLCQNATVQCILGSQPRACFFRKTTLIHSDRCAPVDQHTLRRTSMQRLQPMYWRTLSQPHITPPKEGTAGDSHSPRLYPVPPQHTSPPSPRNPHSNPMPCWYPGPLRGRMEERGTVTWTWAWTWTQTLEPMVIPRLLHVCT